MAGGEERRSYATGLMALGAVLVAAAGLVWALLPARAPHFKDPNFIEAIFDSRFAITCARLALLTATIYAVTSMVALMCRQQWLTGLGPFKAEGVSNAVRTLKQERDDLDQSLALAIDTIGDLEAKLTKTETELASIRERWPTRGE